MTVEPPQREAAPPKEPGVSVKVGDVTVVDEPGVVRVAIADPKVLEVKSAGAGKPEPIGKAAGVTSLLLWNASSARKSLRVSVTP